mmetsp:Transcript_27054/g.50579  ORF Transcript_27054/g.50579 Transcript_27054/m.50579 type:complete len:720 (-) Transcript_27054:281-2440(-)
MEPTEDIDGLWEGLNLGGLLNDLARENESALAQAKKLQAKRDPFKKHNKMLKNPAYSAIMDRYGAAPPKPKLMAKSTLNRLSDPIKGRQIEENHQSPQRTRVVRDTKVHPRKQNKPVAAARHRSSSKNHASHERDPYDHSPIRKEAWGDTSQSPTKYPRPPPSPEHDMGGGGGTGFFITGTNDEGEDYGDEDFESPPPSPGALRRQLEQGKTQGPEVSPIDLVGVCMVESPGAGARAGGYSPPDIYSPRTKEALRASFNKEQVSAPVLPPPKKSFNPLKFSDPDPTPVRQPTRKTRKPLVSKPVKSKPKPKTKTRASSKTRGATGRTRGSSIERQSKVGLRKSTRKTTAGDELTFDVPSKRVQLLSNKMHANKNSRASSNNSVARGRNGENVMMRSSSVKGIRSSSNSRDRGAQNMSGSRSAPSLKRRQGAGRGTSEERLPTISAATSKPTSLPALRAKNLLGRKSVSPALQEKYSSILQSSKEACRDDPPPAKKTAPGFGASSGTGRTKTSTLQPIMEKQGSIRKKTSTVESRKMEKKLKTRRETVAKQEEVKSPGRLIAEDKEKRKKEEKLRRDEQEKRIEARMLASKKKEEMDYRKKIREQAQESAAKSKQRDMSGSVDEKLISMFKTHCLRVTTKLSEADRLSADFKALKEFDGYSSSDRLKLRPEEDSAPPPSVSSTQVASSSSATSDVKDTSTASTEVTSDVNVAFLSKQLMV